MRLMRKTITPVNMNTPTGTNDSGSDNALVQSMTSSTLSRGPFEPYRYHDRTQNEYYAADIERHNRVDGDLAQATDQCIDPVHPSTTGSHQLRDLSFIDRTYAVELRAHWQ
jgi:hypothetical protein